jgi:hypothetical protein
VLPEVEPLVEPVEATEPLWPVVSLEVELLELGLVLAVEEVGEDDAVLLVLGGVEVWSAYVPLVPCAVLEDEPVPVEAVVLPAPVGSVELLLAVLALGLVELEFRPEELLWPGVLPYEEPVLACVLLLSWLEVEAVEELLGCSAFSCVEMLLD